MRSGRKAGWMQPGLEARARPTTLDIAWAAGVYEGEGTCGKRSQVAVAQKDRWILEKLQLLFGGSFSIDKRTGVSMWRISGARARGFLMTIYSFLSPRRSDQVRKVLLGDREAYLAA